jgi:glyoxylase-like metal-dependent hydrolase (beta-lactamase superfamily II)
MKKNVKRIWMGAGILFALLVLFLGIRIYNAITDLRNMTPVETGEIVTGVYSIRDSIVNLFLVKGANRYIAFDSGNDPKVVRRELKKLNIDPADVAAVFLTHGDSDHTGGLPLFQSAQIYLATEEEQMVDGRKARFFIFKNKLAQMHALLNDNQTVEVDGLKVAAILTPGHTPGSMCYLVNGQYLFTGDSMSLKSGKAGIFSKTINMDNATQLESLKKLAGLKGVRYVFTAHYGYTDSFDKAFETFR